MTATASIREAATLENLERAWLWIRTSSDRRYKEYFRPLYRAYSLGLPERLRVLRELLLSGTYEPELATKCHFPKKSGVLRPYSLLTVDDQIVYQALTNVIAERHARRAKGYWNRSVFGHVYAGRRSLYFYSDWRVGYRRFTSAMTKAFRHGLGFSASFDLTACYDSIDHSVLRHFLLRLRLAPEFIDLLCSALSRWTENHGGNKPIFHGHGIPQGPLSSGLLAEVVLSHFDQDRRMRGVRYFRYVDDIRLFANAERPLRQELVSLDLRVSVR